MPATVSRMEKSNSNAPKSVSITAGNAIPVPMRAPPTRLQGIDRDTSFTSRLSTATPLAYCGLCARFVGKRYLLQVARGHGPKGSQELFQRAARIAGLESIAQHRDDIPAHVQIGDEVAVAEEIRCSDRLTTSDKPEARTCSTSCELSIVSRGIRGFPTASWMQRARGRRGTRKWSL